MTAGKKPKGVKGPWPWAPQLLAPQTSGSGAQLASISPHPWGWPSGTFHLRGLGFEAARPIARLWPREATQTSSQNFLL